jgi:hypothetical protein
MLLLKNGENWSFLDPDSDKVVVTTAHQWYTCHFWWAEIKQRWPRTNHHTGNCCSWMRTMWGLLAYSLSTLLCAWDFPHKEVTKEGSQYTFEATTQGHAFRVWLQVISTTKAQPAQTLRKWKSHKLIWKRQCTEYLKCYLTLSRGKKKENSRKHDFSIPEV